MWQFLLSIAALSIIVFIHEFGHYIVARAMGVGVEIFSVGFGKILHSFTDKRGTKWQFCAIPLGGYIHPKDSNNKKIVGSKFKEAGAVRGILVALAGPMFNFIGAFLAITMLAITLGYPQFTGKIAEIMPSSCLVGKAMSGDVIVQINKQDLDSGLIANAVNPIVTLQRGEAIIDVQVIKGEYEGYKVVLDNDFIKLSVASAVKNAFWYVYHGVKTMLSRVVGAICSFNISGPIGIIKSGVQVQKHGVAMFIIFLANISIALGAFNLLPVPLLDGGRVIVFLLSAILRRPIPASYEKVLAYLSIGIMAILFSVGFFVDIKGLLH